MHFGISQTVTVSKYDSASESSQEANGFHHFEMGVEESTPLPWVMAIRSADAS